MSGPVVKNCLNCRIALGENTNGAIQCPKCKKNEGKYGKPSVCQFCKLNAAFHEKKCVWCAHSERKFGDPIHCANCKLNCAFPKNMKARKANETLCRLCIMQARQTNQTHLAGVLVPLDDDRKKERKENEPSSSGSSTHQQSSSSSSHNKPSSSSSSSQKRKHERIDEPTPPKYGRAGASLGALAAETIPDFENQNKIQKLNDEISRLSSVIQSKDKQLMEKDKIISNLKADNYNQEKKHRERLQQMQKDKEESIRMIEHIRNKSSKK